MNGWGWSLCVGLVHVGGALNMLFQGLSNVILERDWVVVLADGDDTWLRSITANLKSIDLSCNLVAPFFVSLIQMAGGSGTIAWALSAGNLIMIYLQYTALHRIYHDVPALAVKEGNNGEIGGDAANCDDDTDGLAGAHRIGLETEEQDGVQTVNSEGDRTLIPPTFTLCNLSRCVGQMLRNCFAHAHTYAHQQAFLPGLALASLYMTVLTFHSTMLAYLLTQGLHVTYIALAQGGSSGLGVLGTLLYSWAAARIGTVRVGVLALWQQVACLTVAVGALFYPSWQGNHYGPNIVEDDDKVTATSLGVFIAAIALSRLGLYAFDVAAAQLFQYLVIEKVRGVVGGFQRTLEAAFELLSYCLVLWRPRPEQFPSLAAISYFQVVAAALLFTLFACRTPEGFDTLEQESGPESQVTGDGGGSGNGGRYQSESAALVDPPLAQSPSF